MNKEDLPKNLGTKLRAIRISKGWSLDKMAEALGRKGSSRRSRVHEWENGLRIPHPNVILAYAKIAGVTTDELIDDDLPLNLEKGDK